MRQIEARIGILFAAFLLVFVVAFARAGWIQAVRGSELASEARSQQNATLTVPGERGTIVDRHGSRLAVDQESATIFATPYQLRGERQLERIAKVLELPVEEIRDAVADRSSGFAYLARDVSPRKALEVEELGIEGVGSLPDSKRVYPQGGLAGQLIGAVGVDEGGLFGVEQQYEELLAGVDGETEVVRDANGADIDREVLSEAERGGRLRLTIDAAIQSKAEQVLAGIGETYAPLGATAIVVDPRNSQVLAMASWPQLHPGGEIEDVEATTNLATGLTYEPGSTFKAFTVAGALEDGVVKPSTPFELPPTIEVADRTIEESHERGAVTLSTAEILAQSSNVGAVKIGLLQGENGMDRWIRRFGFGTPTGITLPGEESGIVIDRDEYSGSTIGNLPIGQGLAVTPLQVTAAYAAIANGGTLRTPQIVLADGEERVERDPGERVLKSRTARSLSRMLEGVLASGGTASEVSVPGYVAAGKTGTSEKVVDGTYSETQFVGSFVGFAPADDPRLLVTVAVDEPTTGGYYGGTVAAPAFAEIASFALPYLGVEPSEDVAEPLAEVEG